MLVGSKENCLCKNALETFDDASIMPAVFTEVKEPENFRSRSESHNAVLLADCQRGNPNRDETVLAVWKSEIGMRDDVKKEFAVSPTMDELLGRGTAERQAAQNKGAGIEGKLLTTILPLLAHKTDGFELLQLVFG
jgi:hypothetical protein